MNETPDEIVRALRCYASDCDDDDACFQCTFAWMCDECDGNAPEIIAARIDSLTSQLAESQRREQAAVEDLKISAYCRTCAKGCGLCEALSKRDHEGGCKDYEWRGPQEAGKGDSRGAE